MQVKLNRNACFWARSFKSALFLLSWVLISSSCITQRRVANYLIRHPLPADTVMVSQIEYVDTTLYLTLPAEVIHDSIPVNLPCPEAETFVSDTVKAELKFVKAAAWISDSQLKIRLNMDEVKLEFHIDSLAEVRTKTVTITKNIIVPEKYVPPFYKASVFVNIILILLFVIIIFISLRR